MPAYCSPSRVTVEGPDGGAVSVTVTVTVGSGVGSGVEVAVGDALGSGDGETVPGIKSVKGVPGESDVPEKEKAKDDAMHYAPPSSV